MVFVPRLLILEDLDHQYNLISQLYYLEPLIKFHSNPFISFGVMLSTNRQIDRQTNATKNLTSLNTEKLTSVFCVFYPEYKIFYSWFPSILLYYILLLSADHFPLIFVFSLLHLFFCAVCFLSYAIRNNNETTLAWKHFIKQIQGTVWQSKWTKCSMWRHIPNSKYLSSWHSVQSLIKTCVDIGIHKYTSALHL